MPSLAEILLVIQSLLILCVSVVLLFLSIHMKRVCIEMRDAQFELIGLKSKQTGFGSPGTREEGTSIDASMEADKP